MMPVLSALVWLACSIFAFGQDTISPRMQDTRPEGYEEMWAGIDPRLEPLEVEVLEEWEEDDVVMRVLRYRIGIFKGKKSMMAAIFGFPKGAKGLPGLVQIHGGGQYADYRAVLSNAKRGYATVSIAWAGRINAPGYKLTPAEVKLFWDGATGDPSYKITTDWGALDGYHAPSRNPGNSPANVAPKPWTLDPVESPRNSPWFLWAFGARRALTFLEQQAEVDPERLGVYGHSMGGKITVLTAGSDARVKAAAPSCGGISHRATDSALFNATLADDVSLKRITCPIIFLSPANDFHGRIDDLPASVREIQSEDWRVTCSPHHNHQDTPEYEVATQLWFDKHLRGTLDLPLTPGTGLQLGRENGVLTFTVRPDASMPIRCVDIFYTQQGKTDGRKEDRDNTVSRFWHHVAPAIEGGVWKAELPLGRVDKPLWVYANVLYGLEQPVSGAGYYYGSYTTDQFNLSSVLRMVGPGALTSAGIRPTLKPSLLIESFDGDWGKEWFTYRPEEWGRRTHKVYDDRWQAPAGARLSFEVLSDQANQLVVGIDDFAAVVNTDGVEAWQGIDLSLADFKNALGDSLESWDAIKELRLAAKDRLKARDGGEDKRLALGANWKGADPKFRDLRWVVE